LAWDRPDLHSGAAVVFTFVTLPVEIGRVGEGARRS
jgi:hypothetical protein